MPHGRQMDITMYKLIHFILLRATTSLAAASAIRRLTAACGLVLLARVLTRTTWVTIVALSTQPATVTVSAAFQSAVSSGIFCLIFLFCRQEEFILKN